MKACFVAGIVISLRTDQTQMTSRTQDKSAGKSASAEDSALQFLALNSKVHGLRWLRVNIQYGNVACIHHDPHLHHFVPQT